MRQTKKAPHPVSKSRRKRGSGVRLNVPSGFCLRETVLSHGWHQLAPFRWDEKDQTLYRCERDPSGSAHVFSIRQERGIDTPLRVRWLTEEPPAPIGGLLQDRIRRILNLELDLSGFWELCRREPRLRYVPRVGAGRFLRCGDVYEEVFKAICATNISWRQAVSAVNRVGELGRQAPGTDLRCFPGPDQILEAGNRKLRGISRLGYRVPYLLEWARRVRRGDAVLQAVEAGSCTREEASRFLLSVKGVGKATSRYLLMVWGHGSEISIDSSVFLYCRSERFNGRTPTVKEIESLYEPFGSWKAYAYWFEFLPWAKEHWGLTSSTQTGSRGVVKSRGARNSSVDDF
jgi:3-methyladenine DNA glycosylase/8-oxoguanine DNA glycosylase